MAHADQATQEFYQSMKERPEQLDAKKNIVAQQGVSFVKGLATGGVKDLPRNITKRVVALAALRESEKSASLNVLKTFKELNDKYGQIWWDWEPETVWQTLQHDYLITHVDDQTKNLIQAMQVVCKTNFPFESWHTFEKVGHAFNMNHVNFDHVQLMDLDQIAYTIKILETMRPGQHFEDDVLGYIAASAKHCGVCYLQEEFFPKGSQEFLDKMGNNEELRDIVKDSKGHYSIDSAVGVQLARLHEIREYVEERL